MRVLAPLTVLLACAPASRPTPEHPVPGRLASESPAPAVPDALAGIVEPWHAFDPAVAAASPVWLLTRYEPGTYPCQPGPDGSLDMLTQDRFRVLQVVRGAAQAPGVDLDLYGLRGRPDVPRAFAKGRRYLLLLQPGLKGQAILADPAEFKGLDDRLGPDDIRGVIDLDASAAETAAEAVPAAKAGPHWDPSRWAAARGASSPDPAIQRELAAALQGSILRPRAPLAEVRAWLGPPDDQHLGPGPARRDQYILARPAHAKPVQGAIYGSLRLRYDAQLELRAVELTFLRWRVRPREQASVALTPEEHQQLGLPQLTLDFSQAG